MCLLLQQSFIGIPYGDSRYALGRVLAYRLPVFKIIMHLFSKRVTLSFMYYKNLIKRRYIAEALFPSYETSVI